MFARQKTRIRGTFATNQTVLQMSGANKTTANLGIVQGMQLQLARQYNNIYSLTVDPDGQDATFGVGREVDAYRIGGRVQGQGQFSRILGPSAKSLKDFYAQMGNECSYQRLSFKLGAAACTAAGTQEANAQYDIIHATMSAASINVNSNDMLVNEGVQLIFADLEVI